MQHLFYFTNSVDKQCDAVYGNTFHIRRTDQHRETQNEGQFIPVSADRRSKHVVIVSRIFHLLPKPIKIIIEISDPAYTFSGVLNHIDLKKYLADERIMRTGCPEYDSEKLLRVILFAFMENGYISVRQIEKLCKTDIRFMWLLDGSLAPSFTTIDSFMNEKLLTTIEQKWNKEHQISSKGNRKIKKPEEPLDSRGFKHIGL